MTSTVYNDPDWEIVYDNLTEGDCRRFVISAESAEAAQEKFEAMVAKHRGVEINVLMVLPA